MTLRLLAIYMETCVIRNKKFDLCTAVHDSFRIGSVLSIENEAYRLQRGLYQDHSDSKENMQPLDKKQSVSSLVYTAPVVMRHVRLKAVGVESFCASDFRCGLLQRDPTWR